MSDPKAKLDKLEAQFDAAGAIDDLKIARLSTEHNPLQAMRCRCGGLAWLKVNGTTNRTRIANATCPSCGAESEWRITKQQGSPKRICLVDFYVRESTRASHHAPEPKEGPRGISRLFRRGLTL